MWEKFAVLEGGEKNFAKQVETLDLLRSWIDVHKGGSPTNVGVYWIHYKPYEISKAFKAETGRKVSNGMVKCLLLELGFKYRKLSKNQATGVCEDRNRQFQVIFNLVLAMSLGSPMISIDCKKKEEIGNLYRDGKCYMNGDLKVYDHDYSHLSEGKVVPHGIYDLQRNEGYVTIGTSHETAEFITDNLLWWWESYGIDQYPDAKNILIFCDSGGGNSYRHHAFKKKLLELAEKIGKDLIICHYPPSASKWNPIEHRLFAQIHLAMEGAVFTDYLIIKTLIEKTTTKTGLKVIARIVDKEYQIGSKTPKSDVDFSRITFNLTVPKLSYKIAC